MKKEQKLQLIAGVAIFIIVTALTYYIMSPLIQSANATANITTNAMTNITTNTTSDISPLTNFYRIITSITAGCIIGTITIFFLSSAGRH
jgi:ABC-type uncharacterized transport system permease subunit